MAQRPLVKTSFSKWCKENLFPDATNSIITIVLLILILYFLSKAIPWAILNAVWKVDNPTCRDAIGEGACWGFIGEKWRLILFGHYPFEQLWRPTVAMILTLASVVIACYRPFWGRKGLISATIGLMLAILIMRGGFLGLTQIPTERWGGLPLTLILAVLGNALAFPFGVLLALGRRSNLPFIKSVCVLYIEFIRGVPLITVLFVASFLFPLFMPSGVEFDKFLRVLIGIMLFAGAYTAECVRAGLQAIPRGQIEAAQALGLSYWKMTRKVVLPQALRMVVPPLMNNFISMFKDTTLVSIVSMFELLGALKLASADAEWRTFHTEGYIFVAIIYFIFCFSMSRYSARLEKRFQSVERR